VDFRGFLLLVTRQAKELKELRKEVAAAQGQAAASMAEANIAKGRNREHERNQKRRVDGAQGGRKRQRRWEARSGSARDDQVDRLKTLARSVFHDDVTNEYVMGLMADAVVSSKAGRDALEKTRYMKKHTKEMEQEAMDRIQEHIDEVGLSAKHCLMMSWNQ
jgi:hypothetical protein